MKILSMQLSRFQSHDSQERLDEAREIISTLRRMNLRWNIDALEHFVMTKQRELFA